jgi:gluconokinase
MGTVVVMGVSGAGKSTIGRALAEVMGADFVEGDELHPPENVARLMAGQPLDDDDRRPWLDAIASTIERHDNDGRGLVVSCSALKRAYRDRLRRSGSVRFVFLDADHDELRRRVEGRTHSFMPPGLLDDQIATLEHPRDEHDVVIVEPAAEVGATVDRVAAALDRTG